MNNTKWIEISVITLGLCATAVIGYGQWNIGQQQNLIMERTAEASKSRDSAIARQGAELQIIELISSHLEEFATCSVSLTSQRMIAISSEYLTSKHGSTAVAEMAQALTKECPENIFEQSLGTRISEATSTVTESELWFAVIASYAISKAKEARAAKIEFQNSLKNSGINEEVNIYRTRNSDVYAIVLGTPTSKENAIKLARIARESEIASDAFAQINREWAEQNW